MDIRIEFRDRELRAALSRLVAAGDDLSPATRAVADHLKKVTERAFDSESDPATGEPWADLSDVTKQRRGQSGRVGAKGAKKLSADGDLIRSITADYDATSAVVGTNLAYATTQHFGAKKGEFGAGSFKTRSGSFPIPWGDIPARPFFGLSPADENAILDIIARHIGSSWPTV